MTFLFLRLFLSRQKPLRVKCLSCSALTLLLGSLGRAQEINRPLMASGTGSQEYTQSDSINAMAQASGFRFGPIGGHFNSVTSVVYDDNIYIQPSRKTSDVITTLSPGITLGAGDYVQHQESWVTLDYSPSLLLFAKNSRNDSVDQNAKLNFEWRPASWTFGVEQQYLRLSTPVVEAGDRVDRSEYDTHLYVRYDFSPKTSFEIDGDQSIDDYGTSLFSYKLWNVSGWMDYWITPKVKVGVGVSNGWLNVSQNADQIYQQALFRFAYDFSENIQVRGYLGGELREFQNRQRSRENGTYSLGGTYKIGDGTQLVMDAYRNDESSIIAVDQNYTLTGISAGLHQLIVDKYILSLTGGFDHSDYYATAPGVHSDGEYNFFFVRPAAGYQVTAQLVAELFYQYQQNRSTQTNAFNDNQAGVNVVYHF